MTIRNKQHTLLLAIVVAVVAVCWLVSTSSRNVPGTLVGAASHQKASAIFPTVRSSHCASAQARGQQKWTDDLRDASASENRSNRFSKLINNANAPRAVEWASAITDDHLTRSSAMQAIFAAWGQRNPKVAGAYVSTLQQSDQPDAIVAIAPELVRASPTDALSWAGNFTDEDARDLATHHVIIAWADDHPADAAKWTASQPESFNRADQVRSIVEKWMDRDARAAMDWVGTLPQGVSRDSAIDFIANQYTKNNPSFAANCALLIGRTELRDARLDQLTSTWLRLDPNGAQNWIDSSSLPDAIKARLAAQSATH